MLYRDYGQLFQEALMSNFLIFHDVYAFFHILILDFVVIYKKD